MKRVLGEGAIATIVPGDLMMHSIVVVPAAGFAIGLWRGLRMRVGIMVFALLWAAITPYPHWGAYGASKAALHHMSRIWDGELTSIGIRVLSNDPGDMDTPLHTAAVPGADRSSLKDPASAAHEVAGIIAAALSPRTETVQC